MTIASERVVNGIKTRVLHGKDYVEVAERVRIAHGSEHQFEQVETLHFAIAERWFVRCSIMVDGKLFIGTAEIKFTAPKNTPDGTNPYECAETSALGRALAFAGLGTVESIASFDEVYRVEAIEDATMHGRPVVEAAPAQRQLPPAQSRDEALHDLAKPGPARAGKPLTNGDGSEARPKAYSLEEVKALFLKLFKPEKWEGFKMHVLELERPDEELLSHELDKLHRKLVELRDSTAASHGK